MVHNMTPPTHVDEESLTDLCGQVLQSISLQIQLMEVAQGRYPFGQGLRKAENVNQSHVNHNHTHLYPWNANLVLLYLPEHITYPNTMYM